MTRPPIIVTAGGVLAVAALVATTAHAIKLHRRLAEADHRATHDPLTGLLNRDGLTRSWVRFAPAKPTIAVIDLDGFKPINDTYGHAAGDRILTATAQRLLAAVTGAAARLGGDEFALILPVGGAAAAAHTLAARLAEPVLLEPDDLDDDWPPTTITTAQVTASIGLATGDACLDQLLARADAAMYRAKSTGSTVAVYDPRRDDHPALRPGIRPRHRVRDLSAVEVAQEQLMC